jgi:hypothetical protein
LDNPFAELFLDFAGSEKAPSDTPKRPRPALILNATDVEQGDRVVISPFIIHALVTPIEVQRVLSKYIIVLRLVGLGLVASIGICVLVLRWG